MDIKISEINIFWLRITLQEKLFVNMNLQSVLTSRMILTIETGYVFLHACKNYNLLPLLLLETQCEIPTTATY